MKSSSLPEKSDRLFRSRRFLALVGVSLFAIGLALFAVIMDRGGSSARFDALREGMTMAEVQGVLNPTFVSYVLPASVNTMTGIYLPSEPLPSQIVYYWYSETTLFPAFFATLTYEKGHLAIKELKKPSIPDILAYWWRQVWERAGA
jgi:hypothetical protein